MLHSRALIAGRYAFLGLLKNSQKVERWVGVDNDTGRRVVFLVVEASRVTTLEFARGVKHRHLTCVIDLLREVDTANVPSGTALSPGFGLAVAEFVPGTTLRSVLLRGGLNASKAVAWTLRIADAMQTLHAANAVHGAVSPRSVIALPEGRAIAPVLSQLVAPAIGCYCPPERLKGALETTADDVWALHATLYTALTCQLPYAASTRDALLKQMLAGRPKPLSAFGIDEPLLQEILDRGLAYEKRVRVNELSEFVNTLDGWERDRRAMPAKRQFPPRTPPRSLVDIVSGARVREDGIVIDDATLPDDEGAELEPRLSAPLSTAGFSGGAPSSSGFAAALSSSPIAAAPVSSPSNTVDRARGSIAGEALGAASPGMAEMHQPPAPAPPSTGPSRRISINPFERRRSVWPFVVIAALASGGGVYLAIAPDADLSKTASGVASASAVTVKAPPTERKKLSPGEERTACVQSYFDPGSLDSHEDVTFVCDEGDFRATAGRLYQMARVPPAVPADAGASRPPDAARAEPEPTRGLELDWYELPATAVIRKACCANSAPVTLPETAGWCEQLQAVVRRIAENSTKAGDLAPDARSFDKAVACLFASKVLRSYSYERAPSAANRAGFQQFLSRAAISEARR